MSSIAIFLVLGGAGAVAAKKIGKHQLKPNSVTTSKIKRNAVTLRKIRNGAVATNKIRNEAVTGAKVNEASLGQVPSAAFADSAATASRAGSADSADRVAGRVPFSLFIGAGSHDIAAAGPFTVRAVCTIDNAGNDEGELQLLTSVDGGAMDANGGEKHVSFDVADSPAKVAGLSTPTGEPDIEVATAQGLIAVAPDGTAIVTQNESIGLNIAGRPGQCYFGGLIQRIG